MATYFGNLTSDDYWAAAGEYTYYGIFTCPGSGSQEVKELSACLYYATTANVRLAIYSANGATLIAQGTGEVLCDQTSSAGVWQGHMTQASITPNPATLTGGTSYILAFSLDASQACRALTAGVATNKSTSNADYTNTGFPASITLGDYADYYELCIRCGVEPAAAGGSNYVPTIMHFAQMRRN